MKSGFNWIRIPASTLHRLMTQRSFLTFQRNAWRDVALEQAQTIATLRKLLIARGPRVQGPQPVHSYRDEAYRAAGVHMRAMGKSPSLQARYDTVTGMWIEPDLAGLPNDVRARLWPPSHSATPPRAMVLGDFHYIEWACVSNYWSEGFRNVNI